MLEQSVEVTTPSSSGAGRRLWSKQDYVEQLILSHIAVMIPMTRALPAPFTVYGEYSCVLYVEYLPLIYLNHSYNYPCGVPAESQQSLTTSASSIIMFEKTSRKLAAAWRKRTRQPGFYMVSKPHSNLTGGHMASPVGSRRWSLATETTSLRDPLLAANEGAEVYHLAKSSSVSHLKPDNSCPGCNLDTYPQEITILQGSDGEAHIARPRSNFWAFEEIGRPDRRP